MSELPPFRRFTFRVVLLKVSPIIVRLISVPDELSLDEFHEVLQLTFGWRRDPFYTFRIHGQQISRRRHLRTRRLSEFQLRHQEKFLYTYDPLSMWEWEIRLVDIEPGSNDDERPYCLSGRAAIPPEDCGGPRGYMQILDRHKYQPPYLEQHMVEQVLERLGATLGSKDDREFLREVWDAGLKQALKRLEEYADFEPDRFILEEVNERLDRFMPYGRVRR